MQEISKTSNITPTDLFRNIVQLNDYVLKAHISDENLELMRLFYGRLSEKDRRQYAGLEALKIGKGGTNYISSVLRIDKASLIRGKKELLSDSNELLSADRQRIAGGGRKKNDKISRDQGIA